MEKEEAEEKESVRKTEKERHEMKYKVGDKVRVRRDLEEYGQYGKYGANRNMAELHGSIVEIKKEYEGEEITGYLCPTCKEVLRNQWDDGFIIGNKKSYCDKCGQRLDWSDEQ